VEAKVVLVTDDDFPQLLSPLPACPSALWFRGNLDAISLASVGIVGARRCTNYGIEQATNFAKEIVRADISVISGGARGIDAAAHRAALKEGGSTVAVLGSGLSVVYPPEHGSLFDSIVSSGGVVMSEFPCNRPPQPAYFPRRNRIVSGLSSVVLVVEAARRSGALITARIAVEEHGRQCFAVPGRIGDNASAGCLQSIRDGWVGIAVHPEDIIEEAVSAWSRLSSVSRNEVPQ
jgi:DNA processing protein